MKLYKENQLLFLIFLSSIASFSSAKKNITHALPPAEEVKYFEIYSTFFMIIKKYHFYFLTVLTACLFFFETVEAQKQSSFKVGVFEADVTPPIGSPVAYAKTRSVVDPLSARGLVFFIDGQQPVVLCAVDWIGIANEGQDLWKKELAEAAHTTPDRVSVHALHQHDGVQCDITMEKIMNAYEINDTPFDSAFQHTAIHNVADAVADAAKNAQEITHIGFGQTKVEKVASNRRILGANGKVEFSRWSSGNDSSTMAKPEGLVDPWLKCVSLWNNDKPVAVVTYYATHPQSYYGKGDVTCEFVGRARNNREKTLNGLPHIHFNGAGGNITSGKYNDGTDSLRQLLTQRMEVAMQKAWENTKKTAVSSKPVWKSMFVTLPVARNSSEEKLRQTLADTKAKHGDVIAAAERLAWLLRSKEGVKIAVSSLRLGKYWLLNLPGELFVEYQLAAQKMKPGAEVCTAAYEDYGPGYIGTAIAYDEGGYETSAPSSGVAPEVEAVLMDAIKKVLK
ncbi:MAG TPA: hypothetical protein VM101_14115 [Flavitalea sp.]|nr:hypothetical protein [Flavitalea sp.]